MTTSPSSSPPEQDPPAIPPVATEESSHGQDASAGDGSPAGAERWGSTRVLVMAALLGLSGGAVAGESTEDGHSHSKFGQLGWCTDDGHEIYEVDSSPRCRHSQTTQSNPQ